MATQYKLTTTGTQNPVVIDDLGGISFTHPSSDVDLVTLGLEEDIRQSLEFGDLKTSIEDGHITVSDEYGRELTSSNLSANNDAQRGSVPGIITGNQIFTSMPPYTDYNVTGEGIIILPSLVNSIQPELVFYYNVANGNPVYIRAALGDTIEGRLNVLLNSRTPYIRLKANQLKRTWFIENDLNLNSIQSENFYIPPFSRNTKIELTQDVIYDKSAVVKLFDEESGEDVTSTMLSSVFRTTPGIRTINFNSPPEKGYRVEITGRSPQTDFMFVYDKTSGANQVIVSRQGYNTDNIVENTHTLNSNDSLFRDLSSDGTKILYITNSEDVNYELRYTDFSYNKLLDTGLLVHSYDGDVTNSAAIISNNNRYLSYRTSANEVTFLDTWIGAKYVLDLSFNGSTDITGICFGKDDTTLFYLATINGNDRLVGITIDYTTFAISNQAYVDTEDTDYRLPVYSDETDTLIYAKSDAGTFRLYTGSFDVSTNTCSFINRTFQINSTTNASVFSLSKGTKDGEVIVHASGGLLNAGINIIVVDFKSDLSAKQIETNLTDGNPFGAAQIYVNESDIDSIKDLVQTLWFEYDSTERTRTVYRDNISFTNTYEIPVSGSIYLTRASVNPRGNIVIGSAWDNVNLFSRDIYFFNIDESGSLTNLYRTTAIIPQAVAFMHVRWIDDYRAILHIGTSTTHMYFVDVANDTSTKVRAGSSANEKEMDSCYSSVDNKIYYTYKTPANSYSVRRCDINGANDEEVIVARAGAVQSIVLNSDSTKIYLSYDADIDNATTGSVIEVYDYNPGTNTVTGGPSNIYQAGGGKTQIFSLYLVNDRYMFFNIYTDDGTVTRHTPDSDLETSTSHIYCYDLSASQATEVNSPRSGGTGVILSSIHRNVNRRLLEGRG